MIKLPILLRSLHARFRRKICNLSSAAVILYISSILSFSLEQRDHYENCQSGKECKYLRGLIFAFVYILWTPGLQGVRL